MVNIYRKLSKLPYVSVLLILASIPLLVSCGGGTTVDAESYPHPNGAVWIYAYEGDDYVKCVLSGSYNHPAAGDTQIMYVYVAAESGSRTDWVKGGEYYLIVTDVEVRLYVDKYESDYLLLLKFPLNVGDTWFFYGTDITATVTSIEDITVIAGLFNTYKIDCRGTEDFTWWYSPTVGGFGVKGYGSYDGNPVTLELSSFNFPS